MVVPTAAAAMAGLTPADKKETKVRKKANVQNNEDVPVDLNMAPVSAPAAMLPSMSCFPLTASMVELTPLYIRAIKRDFIGPA